MKTSELCTMEEVRKGYNAHIIGFGILIYKNGIRNNFLGL